ncbi:tRNA lysidine(34) synthetase TilS [Mesonia aestuariivivens]|uniref:tRNA(Ile)-lysidine synthase n=1 Tax=Mesonia aestuariivivens TaxID=2796128 RepID=A0ABS6W3P9_9FLAO|nr:tRNA lysidine(34) synthetase TilS [Mesonia aestuariivivens]MBW2962476.1 tRNA lysidine(34) synthetase TilS [Mesonia aestuariivivens]
MLQEFQQHINLKFPDITHGKSLLTISGGIDSVVLAHLCKQIGINFSLAHCNFHLRGEESNQDEVFVKNLAKQLEVEVFTQAFQTEAYAKDHQLSTQLAARELRYSWFYELAAVNNFDYILTAHHANDSLETYLINTIRGTGINGLTGIPERNDKIVRPLLVFSRNQIEAFAKQNEISWREDSSNASDKYVRNKIRHHVIPQLTEENPKFLQSFQQTQQYLKDTASLLEDYTTILFSRLVKEINGKYFLNVKDVKETPHTKAVLFQLLQSFGFTEWNDVYDLLAAQTGKKVFSKTHQLVKDREVLILSAIEKTKDQIITIENEQAHIQWDHKQISIENVSQMNGFGQNIAYLSAQKIKYPLTLRKWQAGDRFIPFGMKGTKKLSDFLKDEKLSPLEKENTWVLISDEKIAWVVGYRIDQRFKVEPHTTTILKLNITHEK